MLNFKVKGSPWKTQQIHGTVCFKIHIKILIFYNLGQTFFWPKKQKFWLYYLQILTLFWPINFLHFQLKCGIQSISYKVLDNKPIGLFCWNETKSSLSAKSAIAGFKNIWLLSVSWNEFCWCCALRWCASTINLLSLFTFYVATEFAKYFTLRCWGKLRSIFMQHTSNLCRIWLFILRHGMLISTFITTV